MTKARDLAELIGNSLIDGDEIATGAVGTSNLATTLDFSSKTMVMANDQLSGDKIHGGTISGFTSTGIDDNATGTILTVVDGPKLGIGYASPVTNIHVLGTSGTPNVGLTLQTHDTANAVASIDLMSRVADNTNRTVSIQNILGRLDINSNMDIHGVGTNFKSESYNILNLQTDTNDNGSSDDGIFKITNGSAGTTKAEFRWDESEDLVHVSYGDHGRHISIGSNGNVGVGTGSTAPASPLHVQADGIGIRLDGTGNTARKIFFRSTSNANKAEIYADGGLKIWTDDAGSDLLLAPAGSLLMNKMPAVTIDDATEYSITEASELNPVATDALYLHNEENSSTYGKVSIHMRSSGGGGASSARITLKNNRSGSSALGFFMRDNLHTTEQREKMYLDSDGNLSLTGTGAVVITATPGTVAGNNSAISLGRTDGSSNIQMNTALAVDVAISGIAGVTVGSTNSNTPSTRLRSANSANGHIAISPKGVEKIRIKSTGEVGIQVVGEDPKNKLSLGHPHESPSDTDRILNWYQTGSELHNSNIYQAIVMDSDNTSQPGQIGIALANKNMQVGSWSPAITFGGRSQAGSGDYMNGGAAIASKNFTGSNDGNFIDSELHFFTKGSHTSSERNLSSKMKITGQGTTSITNGDLGHTHFTDKQGRYLTSNGSGWTSSVDGTDPGLVVSSYHTGTEVRNLGIVLHNDTSTTSAKSPTISFGAVSASGSYNTTYAHIVGHRRGTGADTNWASGDLEFYTQPDEAYTRMPNMRISHGGQVSGSMSGRTFGLSSNAWVTFGTLYGAQSTPLHIKVLVGHNSNGGYNEFTNDTYAYNIAAGTVVTIGNTTGSYTAQLRKIKRVGGVGFSSGDGGWEYQIARNQAYGFAVHMHVMGATDAWRWQV